MKDVEVGCVIHGSDEQNFRMKMEERDHVGNLGLVQWMDWINYSGSGQDLKHGTKVTLRQTEHVKHQV